MLSLTKKTKKAKKLKKGGSRAYRVIYALLAGIVGRIFNYKVINREKEPEVLPFDERAEEVVRSVLGDREGRVLYI